MRLHVLQYKIVHKREWTVWRDKQTVVRVCSLLGISVSFCVRFVGCVLFSSSSSSSSSSSLPDVDQDRDQQVSRESTS